MMTYKLLFCSEILLNSLAVKHPDSVPWEGTSQSKNLPLKRIKRQLYGFVITTNLATAKRKPAPNILASLKAWNVWKLSWIYNKKKKKRRKKKTSGRATVHNFRQNFLCLFFFFLHFGGVKENSHNWRLEERGSRGTVGESKCDWEGCT